MKYKVIETRKATMVFEYEVEASSEEQAVQLANEYVGVIIELKLIFS